MGKAMALESMCTKLLHSSCSPQGVTGSQPVPWCAFACATAFAAAVRRASQWEEKEVVQAEEGEKLGGLFLGCSFLVLLLVTIPFPPVLFDW